jgi:hypothetical protein
MHLTPINGFQVADGPDPAKQYPASVDQPFKTALDSRVVSRFANAAARGAAIPVPVNGQMCFLIDAKTYESWDGAKWVIVAGAIPMIRVTPTVGSVPSGATTLKGGTSAGGRLNDPTYDPATGAVTIVRAGEYMVTGLIGCDNQAQLQALVYQTIASPTLLFEGSKGGVGPNARSVVALGVPLAAGATVLLRVSSDIPTAIQTATLRLHSIQPI